MSTKLTLLVLGAATLSLVSAAPAFAFGAPMSNNCANVRTITFSHCVTYDELGVDGYVSQSPGVLGVGGYKGTAHASKQATDPRYVKALTTDKKKPGSSNPIRPR